MPSVYKIRHREELRIFPAVKIEETLLFQVEANFLHFLADWIIGRRENFVAHFLLA